MELIPKCFNCAGPVDPQKISSLRGQDRAGINRPATVVKLKTFRYVMEADIENANARLAEALNLLSCVEKATCSFCSDLLKQMSDARNRFGQATASGSLWHIVQTSARNRELLQAPAPPLPPTQSNSINTDVQQMPATVATTSRSPTKTAFEKYHDWRHVYGLVQLIFESFSRQGCKKQTIKGINDYILSRQPDFFMRNREPNVLRRVLNQFFWNGTQAGYMKHNNRRSASGAGEVQGSTALWTIHYQYKTLQTIHKVLSDTHAPLQPTLQPPSPTDCESHKCEGSRPEPEAFASVAKSANANAKAQSQHSNGEGESVPAKIKKTEEPQRASEEEAKVVEVDVEGDGSDQKRKRPKAADSNEEGPSPRPKSRSNPFLTQVEDITNDHVRLEVVLLSVQVNLSKLELPRRPGFKEMSEGRKKLVLQAVKSLLKVTTELYLALDGFLLRNGTVDNGNSGHGLKLSDWQPGELTEVVQFPIDVLAKYFSVLLRCSDCLALPEFGRYAVVLKLMKLRLLRLLAVQLLAHTNTANANSKSVSVSVMALVDRYFDNIANCLKWKVEIDPATKTQRRIENEDWSPDKTLRAWGLLLGQLRARARQGDEAGGASATVSALDIFAVNVDHRELGWQGFEEKLDRLQNALQKQQS